MLAGTQVEDDIPGVTDWESADSCVGPEIYTVVVSKSVKSWSHLGCLGGVIIDSIWGTFLWICWTNVPSGDLETKRVPGGHPRFGVATMPVSRSRPKSLKYGADRGYE